MLVPSVKDWGGVHLILMKRENKQRGFILLETILAMIMMMFLTYGFVVLYGGNFSLLDGGRTALQAQMIAQSRAAEISVTSFDNLNSVAEARTPVAGTDFDREVVVGAEVDLGGGNKERPIDVYVYKNGDPTDHLGARFKLHLTPTAQGSVIWRRMILAWSGSVADIPIGWQLCDGTNGTPDLRGRFVLGTSSSHPMGQTSGEEKHKLTIDEMPSHNHGYQMYSVDATSSPWWIRSMGTTWVNSMEYRTTTTGGDQPFSIMPPYYALAYIMRVR